MSWVQGRCTQELEDKSYCLLGILGVSMPSNYGEGEQALSRLIEALLREHPTLNVCGLEWFYNGQFAGRLEKSTNANSGEDISSQDRRRLMLKSLHFEQMGSRRSTIKKEYASTCTWLLKHHIYKDWKDSKNLCQHRGLLWISGKPGSGKSTLMNFAHAKASRAHYSGEIVISFFFNARGVELEKTTVGMYRALLFQLLTKAPDLQRLLDEHTLDKMDQGHMVEWSIEQLCGLIANVVTGLGERRCTCFIDALDECDEHQIQDMVHFFEDLGQTALQHDVPLHICFASRPYPTIDTIYGLKLAIEGQQGHDDDLTRYIHNYLRAGTGRTIENVRARVKEKANSVFMWVVLVVNILNQEFKRGYILDIERRLDEIPDGLSDLFRDILQRDRNYMADFRLCLQWLLFSSRPLGREEFYFAMVAGLNPSVISKWNANTIETDYMERYVLSSSKGLAELTKSNEPTVQFIHESVRDFLIKEGGLSEIWSGIPPDPDDLESTCQDQLKRCCQTQLGVDVSDLLPPNGSLPTAKSTEGKTLRQAANALHPFLEYASQNVFYHAERAAKDIDQSDFLASFALKSWINRCNVFELHQIRRYTSDASMSYVLADSDCPRLLRTREGQDAVWSVSAERYGWPIFAALANRHVDCVQALLRHCDRSSIERTMSVLKIGRNLSLRKGETPLYWAIDQDHPEFAEMIITRHGFRLQEIGHPFGGVLYVASLRGHTEIVKLLLNSGADVNAAEDHRGSALCAASNEGCTEIVKLLLNSGANVNVVHAQYGTALCTASYAGNTEIVKLLLNNGADVNAQDGFIGNALRAASLRGHTEIVKLLLNSGADVNAADRYDRNALYAASDRGHTEIVRLLLNSGADVNAADSYDRNALYAASDQGHTEIVRLLLNSGADVNAADSYDRNALYAASDQGHTEIVRLLLNSGADVNAADRYDMNALYAASDQGHTEIVRLLLNSGADVNAADSYDRNALCAASDQGHTEIVRLLLEYKADVNAEGGFALQTALNEGHTAIVELLVTAGATKGRSM